MFLAGQKGREKRHACPSGTDFLPRCLTWQNKNANQVELMVKVLNRFWKASKLGRAVNVWALPALWKPRWRANSTHREKEKWKTDSIYWEEGHEETL